LTLSSATLSTTQKSNGAQSLYYNGASQYATATVDGSSFNHNDYTITFDWYPTTCANSTLLVRLSYNTTNRVSVYDGTNCNIKMFYAHGGTTKDIYSGASKTVNNWYRVTAKAKTGVAGTDMSISICDLNVSTGETSNCVSASADRDIASMDGNPTTCTVGNNDSGTGAGYIDRLRLTSGDSGF
jgi:hypothetical protein